MTFLAFPVIAVGFIATLVFLLGMPGKIAYDDRKYPDADAGNMMGWVGFLAFVHWMQAILWAFMPTHDIRPTPTEERKAIEEAMAALAGKAVPQTSVVAKSAGASRTCTTGTRENQVVPHVTTAPQRVFAARPRASDRFASWGQRTGTASDRSPRDRRLHTGAGVRVESVLPKGIHRGKIFLRSSSP
jgi:hypothetical protein